MAKDNAVGAVYVEWLCFSSLAASGCRVSGYGKTQSTDLSAGDQKLVHRMHKTGKKCSP